MKWKAFEIDEVHYDLNHLKTSTFNFNRPATETSEEKAVKITLSFSDRSRVKETLKMIADGQNTTQSNIESLSNANGMMAGMMGKA